MLDQIFEAAKGQLGGQLASQFGLNSNQTGETLQIAQSSVTDGLKKEALSGNFDGLLSLFNGKSQANTSNPIVSGMVNSFVSQAASKIGISAPIAQQVGNFVIPFIMDKFSSKETGEAKDAGDLMGMLGMGNDSGIAGMLGNLMGGDAKGGNDLLGGIGKLFG